MKILLNGQEKSFNDIRNINDLVSALKLDQKKIAVELNLEIVPKSTYSTKKISEGDRIEIVNFIAGG